ncbi:MAG: T9SS type A sorting domain-containing protein [Bacteroidales bacterium]|nr:T9SS type A sorting domain-containing protein [Bacteroidales bacterium]
MLTTYNTTYGINQLGAINFYDGYLGNSQGGGNFFIDNFTVYEIESSQPGVFVIEPETPIIQNFYNTGNFTLNLSNQGGAPIDYEVIAVYDIPNTNPTSTGAQVITHYSVPSSNSIMWSAYEQYTFASGYSPTMLQEYIGKTIQQFDIGLINVHGILSAKLCIWDMGPFGMPSVSPPIYEQAIPVSSLVEGVSSIPLSEPWLIDGRYLYIGVELVVTPAIVKIALDGTPLNQCNYLGRIYKRNVAWALIPEKESGTNLPLNGVWNMTVHVDGAPIKPWIALDHTSASLQPDVNKNLNISFGADDVIDSCTKKAKLYFFSTDFQKEETIINATIHFYLVGIEDINTNNLQVKIFPNPASDSIIIECNIVIESVQIFNETGQVVLSKSVKEEKTVIDTSNLLSGIYLIVVKTDNNTHTGKLIIK